MSVALLARLVICSGLLLLLPAFGACTRFESP
jgi:hypothetical protein